MFGPERMVDALRAAQDASPQEIMASVDNAVSAFVGSAPQFDDITMLALRYFGSEEAQNG